MRRARVAEVTPAPALWSSHSRGARRILDRPRLNFLSCAPAASVNAFDSTDVSTGVVEVKVSL